jgi:hypothetical protein
MELAARRPEKVQFTLNQCFTFNLHDKHKIFTHLKNPCTLASYVPKIT